MEEYLNGVDPKTGVLYVINLATSLKSESYRIRSMYNAAAGTDGGEKAVAP
jgi:hypothetical protein